MLKQVLHLRSSGGMLGAENVILEIAKHSEMFGYKSHIGLIRDPRDPDSEFLKAARDNGLQAEEFVCPGRISYDCAKQIKKYIQTHTISVLHCHGYKENMHGILARSSIPKIATNHLWKINSLMLRLYKLVDIFLLRNFDMVVGVSDEIVNEMKKFGIRKPFKIQNGIDINKFIVGPKQESIIKKFGLNGAHKIFGMISSITFEKNHTLAIKAMSRLSSVKAQLIIVGDGPLVNSLKEQVESLGLKDRVFFVGKQNNINEILSIIDVFLLPSIKEGLPMALLEAMACGKAVIATKVGENANLIDNFENGILVELEDTDAFAEAMQSLIFQDDFIQKIGSAARRTVQSRFTSELMTQKYCKSYDRLIV